MTLRTIIPMISSDSEIGREMTKCFSIGTHHPFPTLVHLSRINVPCWRKLECWVTIPLKNDTDTRAIFDRNWVTDENHERIDFSIITNAVDVYEKLMTTLVLKIGHLIGLDKDQSDHLIVVTAIHFNRTALVTRKYITRGLDIRLDGIVEFEKGMRL